MAKTFMRKYGDVKLISDRELALELGISVMAVNAMKNKRKKLLLKLGLMYKQVIDRKTGFEIIRLCDIPERKNGRKSKKCE